MVSYFFFQFLQPGFRQKQERFAEVTLAGQKGVWL
jgi:hypothetical protein